MVTDFGGRIGTIAITDLYSAHWDYTIATTMRALKPAFHDADTDTDSPDTPITPIHPYVRHERFPREVGVGIA